MWRPRSPRHVIRSHRSLAVIGFKKTKTTKKRRARRSLSACSSCPRGFNDYKSRIAMRFAVVGAGAIGAFLGAMLAKSGEDVTLIARGAHLRAMQERGVRVRGSLGEFEARPAVTDDPASIGAVDVALLTLKAHSLIEMAPLLSPLLGPGTCLVSAQNGIPWWYFYRHGGPWEGTRLETVDPGGVISRYLHPSLAISSAS